MEVRSTYKYARISPFKVREVTREIQGLPVSAALDLLAFTPKKAAFLIGKTLKSAIANAENNANLKPDGLVVKEATVGEGPTLKRIMARDNLDAKEVQGRLEAQLPIEEKVKRAHYVIDTNGSLVQTNAQVHKLYQQLSDS